MQPYFSFESDLWAKREGAQLAMNPFERFRDEPVLPCGPKGSPDEHRVEFTNVLRENGRFVMWYTGMRPPPQDPWQANHVTANCIAYSDDGIHWEKPDLRLADVPTNGSPNNVLPDISHKVYNVGVICDGDRYVMSLFYPRGLPIEEGQTTFTILTSEDGLRWHGDRTPCIKEQHFEGACSLFKFRGKYWVLGQGLWPYYSMPDGTPCGRVLFAYESKDLKTWKRGKKGAYAYPIPRHFREAGLQIHAGASPVDRGRIALAFMGQFWPAGFSELVRSTFGLIYSYDGAHWTEPFVGDPFLMPAEKGWDSGMLLQGYGIYSRGDTSYYWYSGLDGGNLWWPHGAAGCVRIRRDGYAHLTPESRNEPARLQSVPIAIDRAAESLYANVEATPANPVDVEVIDARTKKRIAAASVKRAGVLVPAVTLNEKLNGAGKREVAVKFKLNGRSKLYAFYTGPTVQPEEYLSDWMPG